MKKSLKYSLGAIAAIIIIFLSLDIQKLDEFNAENTNTEFNAIEYAHDVWENSIPNALNDAPDIIPLLLMLETNQQKAFKDFGRKLGISNTRYFIAKGEGVIQSVEDEYIIVQMIDSHQIELETAFIFGNTMRDGSGVVDINDFVNMTDFNQVSVVLNKLVKEEVIAGLKEEAQPGLVVEFVGTFEINENNIEINSIRTIPVSIRLGDGK